MVHTDAYISGHIHHLCVVYTKKMVALLSDKTVKDYFSEQNELFFNRMDRSM